ncbi:sodium- and chloride-dependent glycine transporter 1-like [Brevipalpus obovatus]|uniref:sodium- and chloride-dependent glycine transporter 1-like n=1 Tax=Brevipalpus obovatus TaxID=246614 RepID=UPI003D9EBFED
MPARTDSPVMIKITKSSSDYHDSKERGNWSSKIEFLFSGLSYAVGLGNVWRFPYLVYRNGGGAFFIPYTIMLAFVGLPLFLLEISFGQYASEGPITIWKVSPLFSGLGYSMFLMSGLVAIYYNMILAWALFYLFSSFTSELPWSSCENEWNTDACRRFDSKNCTSLGGLMNPEGECLLQSNVTSEIWQNLTKAKINTKFPSDEYFHNFVLGISSGIHEVGEIRLQLVICLLICWIIVFFCLFRGVKSLGKVVYFTAIFPYFVLTILLIRGLTLDGAVDGIKFYLTPDFSRILEVKVWKDAAIQIFFSLSPCWGGLITLASYNKFNNDCFRDTFFIAIGNCATSVYAGFVIFSVIGFMARESGLPISEVAAQGAGLAFIIYPEAVSKLPWSPIWALLFFAMLMTLGLGTQFTMVETVVTTIVDTFPHKFRHRKPLVLFFVCVLMFFVGLLLCTSGGIYFLQLMDDYCSSFSALTIGLVEIIVIAWVYGVDRFLEDIKSMLGRYPPPRGYWKLLWKVVCPTIILIVFAFSIINIVPSSYGNHVFPAWANAIGWFLSFISMSAIPIVALIKIHRSKGPIAQRISTLMQPAPDWGPRLAVHRLEAHSPKHTDSQVPLASSQFFDQDNESEDSEYCKSPSKFKFFDDHNDDAGLRLTLPDHSNETGF